MELARFFLNAEDESKNDFGKIFSGWIIKNSSAISITNNHLFVALFLASLAVIAFILTRPQEFYRRLSTEAHDHELEVFHHEDDHQTRFKRFTTNGKINFLKKIFHFLRYVLTNYPTI